MAVKKISKTEVNKIVNIESIKKTTNIELVNSEDTFANEKFYFTDIYDEKKYKNFIKACEKLIRTSGEYKSYIGYLKNDMGLTNCGVFGNVNKDIADLEFHHFPFTLYDIVSLHIAKNCIGNKKFNTFSIANDVMEEHYENIIGLIPLSKTAHQLVHAGELAISMKQLFGEVALFTELYNEYLTDDMINKYNQLMEISEDSVSLYNSNTIVDCIGDTSVIIDNNAPVVKEITDDMLDMDIFMDKS